jgi:polysaccharide export outer membrane protein
MIWNGKFKILCGSLLLAASLMLVISGCQLLEPKTNTQPPTTISGIETNYTDVMEVGEIVRITLTGPIDLPGKGPMEQRIKDDGTINMEYIGSVQAAGRKVSELQQDIQQRYVPKYYKHLNVVVQYENRVYFVGGQVRMPNKYVYVSGISLLKAIDSAGGFTDFAQKKTVSVTRSNGRIETVNCEKALKNPKLDIPIYPKDKIHVPMRVW